MILFVMSKYLKYCQFKMFIISICVDLNVALNKMAEKIFQLNESKRKRILGLELSMVHKIYEQFNNSHVKQKMIGRLLT